MPPGEGLQADQAAGGELNYRLIMDFKSIVPKGNVKVIGELKSVVRLRRRRCIEDPAAGSAPCRAVFDPLLSRRPLDLLIQPSVDMDGVQSLGFEHRRDAQRGILELR